MKRYFIWSFVFAGISSVAVWAAGINGGGVFTPGLTRKLVEAVTEILYLAGTEDASDAHQLAMVMVVMISRVHMATTSLVWGFAPFIGLSFYWLTDMDFAWVT